MSSSDASSRSAKTAVLVLGAPRSGTSALSHMLSELGVYFGDERDFLDPLIHDHNPVFFELKRLNAVNERVLSELGHEYGAFDYFPAANEGAQEYSAELLADARDLILRELGGRRLIGLKDPRFCFTLPFWRQVLSQLDYDIRPVLTVRPELAIVQSNEKVNKSHPPPYSRRLTWVSTGAAATNLIGEDFAPIAYDHLIEAPDAVAARLAVWLGLPAAKAARATKVIRREFRHETAAGEQPDADIGGIAGNYLDVRNRLESLGILNLVDQRRIQVAERDRLISEQSARIAELTTVHGSPEGLREQLDASARMLQHLDAKIEWQSGALGGLGDFLRDQVQVEREGQEQLAEKVEWQSGALGGLGDFLREQVQVEREGQEQLAAKVEWQSSALVGLGDFVRDQVQVESQMQERLAAKVQWQSDALASFGEHLRQQVDSNRLAQEQLHGEIARLNALLAESVRQAESEAAPLRAQVQELQKDLAQRAGELEEGRLERESSAQRHAEALAHAGSHAAQMERSVAQLRSEGNRLAEELADLRLKLEDSTFARLHAERRAAGFLERIEILTAQLDEARRLVEAQHDGSNGRGGGLLDQWKSKRAGTKKP